VYDNYAQIEELDALNSNTVLNKRIWPALSLSNWGGGKLICDIRNGIAYYALGDANKNITDYIDASGTIQGHYEYSPFGKITASNGAMVYDFDYRFSSEVFDIETGSSYYNYRYYSPELGRWVSRDPIEEKGGLNLYSHTSNNPVNAWDRLGQDFVYGPDDDVDSGATCCTEIKDTWDFLGYKSYYACKGDCLQSSLWSDYAAMGVALACLKYTAGIGSYICAAIGVGGAISAVIKHTACAAACEGDVCSKFQSPTKYCYKGWFGGSEWRWKCPGYEDKTQW
jgi:RHS repeat-associated protein